MAAYIGTEIVNNGLVLHLDAANPRSYPGTGATWFDLSGNRNHGTLNNSPTFDSTNKGNFSFDGVDDYVDTGKTAAQLGIYNSPYTMSAFFKVPNLTGDKMVFGSGGSGNGQVMHHGVRNNTFYFGHYAADAQGGTVVANTWYHGTWIWDTTARIYINTVLLAAPTVGAFIGTTNILIGSSWVRSNINIADVMIYNRALSLAEIQKNFEAVRSRYSI